MIPNFSLPDQTSKIHNLKDYKGQWVLVYFYPKDDTPGCVKEACAIRDNFPAFKKLGIQVFGISADSVKSHAKFAEKYDLPFTLLADEDKKVVKEWGGIARTSFLIDPKGKVAKVYEKVKPETHAEEVLADLSKLLN
ncbi:MAG: peroxiredoxin Q/BCP [Parcubacteria group bacterium Gr01-1014_3]|nr:MAG: peroxiredoxin Q/BCP [Parcubacteria group bacterium Gr01-1014_3]